MQMRLWRGRARLGYAMRFATPGRAKPSRAEATSAAARCRSRCLLHCSTSAYPCLYPRLPASCLLPTTASCLLPASTCCLLLMMPTEMLGLPLLLIALLHLTISGLRFACQMSSCGGSTPPPPLLSLLPPSHSVCTENCQVICQLRLCMQITFASAPDEHCVSFRLHARQAGAWAERRGGGGRQ